MTYYHEDTIAELRKAGHHAAADAMAGLLAYQRRCADENAAMRQRLTAYGAQIPGLEQKVADQTAEIARLTAANAALLAAITDIAQQHKTTEMSTDERDCGDVDDGYNAIIKVARRARDEAAPSGDPAPSDGVEALRRDMPWPALPVELDAALRIEREHQRRIGQHDHHDPIAWITIMEGALAKAKAIWLGYGDHALVMSEIRQATAVGVAAMEDQGVTIRGIRSFVTLGDILRKVFLARGGARQGDRV